MSCKLTAKQKKFADKYLLCGNGTESAIFAKYSKRSAKETASRLLTYDNISEYIKTRQEKTSKKLEITKEWVLEQLKANHDLALTPNGEKGTIDIKASTQALQEINKMLGHLAPAKTELSGGIDIGKIRQLEPGFGDREG